MKSYLRGEVTRMAKSKTLEKLILFFWVASMIFGVSLVSVNAAAFGEPEISPFYENISSRTVNLTISGINADCSTVLKTNTSMKLTIKMELQKDTSDGYETVKTWTDSATGKILSISESRLINILCDYRLKVTFTAGSETIVVYEYA